MNEVNNGRIENMEQEFKNEKPLNEIGKDVEEMVESARTLTSAIGKLLEVQVNLMIELIKSRLQKRKKSWIFTLTKKHKPNGITGGITITNTNKVWMIIL